MEERREAGSRSSAFPPLEEELGGREELGLGPCWTGASCPIVISSSCCPAHKPKDPPLPVIQNSVTTGHLEPLGGERGGFCLGTD